MKDKSKIESKAVEKAKIELSNQTSTEINLPYIMPVDGVPKHLVKTLTRAKFEQLCDDLFQRSIEPCRKALADANLSASDIDEVLLVRLFAEEALNDFLNFRNTCGATDKKDLVYIRS